MGVPTSSDARRFYRCALQRYEEALVLRRSDKTTGAVYLAGYAVECILKSLLLDIAPSAKRLDVLASFRGTTAHNYDWLRSKYRSYGGAAPPKEETRCFYLVADWSTELRYSPRGYNPLEADVFLRSVETIPNWATARN